MPGKQVVLRARAKRDIADAVHYLRREAGEDVADGLIEALERAFDHLVVQPKSGSPRYGHELDLPGLRCWPAGRFPYLIFYVEAPDRLEIWRVLHTSRDIPGWLHE